MIFLAGKVSIGSLLLLILPSAFGVLVLAILLSLRMNRRVYFDTEIRHIDSKDKVIALIFLVTIISTLLLNVMFQVPPVLTFLFGLSTMFLIAHLMLRQESNRNVLNYIREIEFDTLLFFLGVLLIVGVLKEVGVLNKLTALYQFMPAELANYVLGISSALIDNVPLTAALLKANIDMGPAGWLAVTYSTGVGGSLLVIGSAAGIIAMSKVKELNFISYGSMFAYLLLAYSIGYWLSVWVGGRLLTP